jgi:hypothetical protein
MSFLIINYLFFKLNIFIYVYNNNNKKKREVMTNNTKLTKCGCKGKGTRGNTTTTGK